jgi:hypothetical protein
VAGQETPLSAVLPSTWTMFDHPDGLAGSVDAVTVPD